MAKRTSKKVTSKKTASKKSKSAKTEKSEAFRQEQMLEEIETAFATSLRNKTIGAIERGQFLLAARNLLKEKRKWTAWMKKISDKYDVAIRTITNLCNLADYAKRKSNSANFADFSHIATSVLYGLAAGQTFRSEAEAEILRQAKSGVYIGLDRAAEIENEKAAEAEAEEIAEVEAEKAAEAEAPEPKPEPADSVGTMAPVENTDSANAEAGVKEQPVSEEAPTPVQPIAPSSPDLTLADFDDLVVRLDRLVSKPIGTFDGTHHSADKLRRVADFLIDVANRKRPPPFEPLSKPSPSPSPSSDELHARNQPWARRNPADEVAAAQIEREQADLKKRKASGRIAKLKAKKSGETKQMALECKAALAKIKEEGN